MRQRVLVTGGAGFIGSHIADRLVADGWDVAVIDDLSSGYEHNLNPKLEFIKADLASPNSVATICKLQPQIVFHAAARASVPESVQDPLGDISINLVSTMNVLTACVQSKVTKLVFSSSGGAIYGAPKQLPCAEDHPPEPLSPYGAGKFAAELYLRTVCGPSGIQYTALRYANVYGPRQRHTGAAPVVAGFFMSVLAGKAAIIYGDGEQTRDYIHVDDVVEANMAAIKHGNQMSFNIGTGVPLSVNRVYQAICERVGFSAPADHKPGRQCEVREIYLDIKRAERSLGWKPTLSFAAGLKSTQDYYSRVHAGMASS